MSFAAMNWAAVLAGTVGAFLFGWLLYSPMLFGRVWAAGSKVELNGGPLPVFAMGAQLLALFLLALIIGLTETAEAIDAAVLAILAATALVVSTGAFAQKSGAALAVDGLGIVGAGVVMILAQAIL